MPLTVGRSPHLINISEIPPQAQLETRLPDFVKLINNTITHSLTFCKLRSYHGVFSFALHGLSCYSFIHAELAYVVRMGNHIGKRIPILIALEIKRAGLEFSRVHLELSPGIPKLSTYSAVTSFNTHLWST